MQASYYKWSDAERLWMEEHGIKTSTYIGAPIKLPTVRRTRSTKPKK